MALESTANGAALQAERRRRPPGRCCGCARSFKTATSPVIDRHGDEGAHDPVRRHAEHRVRRARLRPHRLAHQPVHAAAWWRSRRVVPPPAPRARRSFARTASCASQPPCPTYFPPGNPDTCVAGGLHGREVRRARERRRRGQRLLHGRRSTSPRTPTWTSRSTRPTRAGNATGEPLGSSASSNNPRADQDRPRPGARQLRRPGHQLRRRHHLRPTHHLPGPGSVRAGHDRDLDAHLRDAAADGCWPASELLIGRGETKDASFGRVCAAATNTAPSSRCVSSRAKVRRKSRGPGGARPQPRPPAAALRQRAPAEGAQGASTGTASRRRHLRIGYPPSA